MKKSTMWLVTTAVLCMTVIASPIGCSFLPAVAQYLPTVIASVTEGLATLDAIKSFVDAFFAIKPDATAERKVNDAIDHARSLLIVAQNTSQGAEDLNQEQIDKAFAEFAKAYAELIRLCEPYGVRASDSALSASRTDAGLAVPMPAQLVPKLKD